jgi:hypothetical protein
MPRCRRSGAMNTPACGSLTSMSPTVIRPAELACRPAIMRSVDVLPQPDGPSKVTNSPCATSRLKPDTTCAAP